MGRGYYSYFLWSMLLHLVKSVNRRCLALYAYNFSTSTVDFIVFFVLILNPIAVSTLMSS